MKKLLVLLVFIFSAVCIHAQTPSQYIGLANSIVGVRGGLIVDSILRLPLVKGIAWTPTAIGYVSVNTADSLPYFFRKRNSTDWLRILTMDDTTAIIATQAYVLNHSGGGGGSGTVTSVSATGISGVFTVNVANPTTTPAITFSLSSQIAFTVLGRSTGSGSPSFVSLDTTYISSFSVKVRSLFSALSPIVYSNGQVRADTSILSTRHYVDSLAALIDTINVVNRGTTGISLAYTSGLTTLNIGKLVAGTNITLTKQSDSSVLIDASGGGAAYTFSTGLTNASSTITSNIITGISGGQTIAGSTSTTSGLNIKATTGNGTTGANITFAVGNNGNNTSATAFFDGHWSFGSTSDVGGFYVTGMPVKLLFDNALHVWDVITIDSSGFLKRIGVGANGRFLGVQGDTLAFIVGGQTNSNVGAAFRAAIPLTNNIKTFAAGPGITIDSATTNVLTFTGTTINSNASGRFILGSGSANTLNATTQFILNGGNELKFTSSAGDAYLTISTTGDPSNPSFFYFPNTDIQVFAHNLLTVSFNGTTAKTYLQSEGSFGAKSFTGSTTDLQMDNTFTEYTFNGSTDKTWFVPAIATANNNRWYIVRNIGSDTLTLSDPGAAPTIFTNTPSVSVIIPPGGGYLIYSNSTYWASLKFVNPNTDPAYGTYTPTLTNQTNVAASTAYQCQYLRIGNSITVSGKVDIDPTAPGATELRLTLPFAPGFANDFEAGGAANSGAVAGESAAISAVSGGGNVAIKYIAIDVSNKSYFFTLTYKYTAP